LFIKRISHRHEDPIDDCRGEPRAEKPKTRDANPMRSTVSGGAEECQDKNVAMRKS